MRLLFAQVKTLTAVVENQNQTIIKQSHLLREHENTIKEQNSRITHLEAFIVEQLPIENATNSPNSAPLQQLSQSTNEIAEKYRKSLNLLDSSQYASLQPLQQQPQQPQQPQLQQLQQMYVSLLG